MAYPQEIDKFIEKLNKLDNNTYVIEEKVEVTNGVYEGELQHDNVSLPSINVYTGSKLTGTKIENVIVSTPSLTPWKNTIKIFSDVSPVYITYQTQGDTVEAEDINKVQDSVVNTQKEVDRYKSSNDNRVTDAENRITTVENNKAEKTYVDTELNKRYLKTETYNKTETDQRIQMVVDAAPEALDTLKEIAKALNNDPDFAATITTELSKKVDKIEGKQLSTEDYTSEEKSKLAGIENNANKYIHPVTHPATMITTDSTHEFVKDTDISNWNDADSKKHTHNNLSILQSITQALIDAWNSAVDHISDTVKHITSAERTLWNTVSNKVDKVSGKGLSTNDFDDTYKSKVDGITDGATKVEDSTVNGNIKISGTENIVYTHPGSGTNPHGTTKSDVGLGNVTNDAQVKRTEMGANSGVATLDSSGVNAQAPKAHTHDDRYYTESESDSKFATKDDLGSAGYGDMLKSTYDKDNDGVVDKAEDSNTVGGKSSSDFAPSGYGLGGSAKRLDSGADLNTIIANGWYDCSNVTNGISEIGTAWHKLLVICSGDTDYVTQLAFSMTNATSGSIWIREKRVGSWGSWSRILTSSKKCTWNDLKGV
jgi:hypothetical protein